MKTIKQQITVQFHAVEVQDIVTMLPLMDNLTEQFNQLCIEFDSAIGDSNASQEYFLDTAKSAVEKYNQLKCLYKFDFIASKPFTLQKHEAMTIAYHYGLGNEIQELMQNGIAPLDALAEFDIL